MLVLVVIMLIFGPQKLPEISRSLGKAANRMKEASGQFTQQMDQEMGEVRKAGQEVTDVVNREVLKMEKASGQFSQQVNEEMGEVRRAGQEVTDVVNRQLLPAMDDRAVSGGNDAGIKASLKDNPEVGFF